MTRVKWRGRRDRLEKLRPEARCSDVLPCLRPRENGDGFWRKERIVRRAPFPSSDRALQTMGMPAVESRRWTAAEVRALPEEPGKRFECVDGELLVSPSPRLPHQVAQSILFGELYNYLRLTGAGVVLCAPFDMELDTYTLVQPDLLVLPTFEGRFPRTDAEIGDAILFIEVLSPSTARYDRIVKRQRYQRHGVEYWIVDVDARLIERWMPTDDRPDVRTTEITWQPPGATEPLHLDIVSLFRQAVGVA
jgi:Uma2 family endonuclease